jgi:L-ascorbate metabolism protein UlaG (beta-lactamase superfamily)
MAHRRQWRLMVALALPLALIALSLAGTAGRPRPAATRAQSGEVTLEWLGWSHFRLTSPGGKVILLNPFIVGNPDAAVTVDDITKADLILAADGHGDEVGSTATLAKNTGARVFVPFELGTWLVEQGVPQSQVVRSNPGGRLTLDGITVRMVGSVHGSGLPAPSATTPYGGPAAGYVITFENGWTVYFVGSSAATQDMALWGEMYKPDAMIFHMGVDHEPLDIAMSVRLVTTNNPNLKTLIPHHHRVTSPPGATTVAQVREALDSMGLSIPITDQVRGQVYRFSK